MAFEVFISYAPQDEVLRSELSEHLSILERQGIISSWYDGNLMPGTEQESALLYHLNTAHIILLLISAHFMASDSCYHIQMARALERCRAGEAYVIPILLRASNYEGTPFAELEMLPRNRRPVISWSDRNKAFAQVVREIRSVADRLIQEGKTVVPSMAATQPETLWNVPPRYSRNPFFTGREDLLARLTEALQGDQIPVAISGLGGIGKTHLAVEYAYRHRQDYRAVFWVQADTQERLFSDFVLIAKKLQLPPEKTEHDMQQTVLAVQSWLRTHRDWLLILDNADDLALVRQFIPPVYEGHILLTTRAQSMGRLALRLEMDILQEDVGIRFLLCRAGLMQPGTSLEQVSPKEYQQARDLVHELGGLPLALDQAGAFLEETSCSIEEYLSLYRTQRFALLNRRGGKVEDHSESVATTWSLAFASLEQANPAAANLLRLCAFLYHDAIPEKHLRWGMAHLEPPLQILGVDALAFHDAVSTLGAYSLLRRDRSSRTLSIHPLVQAVLIDAMTSEMVQQWITYVTDLLYTVLPDVTFSEWAEWDCLLPHVLTCISHLQQVQVIFPELSRRAGWYLGERGRYTEAQALLQQALRLCEQLYGRKHLNTADCLETLGWLCKKQGEYTKAEPLFQRALTIYEEALGPAHPNTSASLNNLAELYREQGKYAEVEPLLQRALKIREQQLGPKHPDTATTLNNLALFYRTQLEYAKAEPLFQRALAIYEGALGPTHPNTSASLNNLAELYQEQEKYAEAEPLLRRALKIREQQLGLEHPNTATTLNNLALCYLGQGKYGEAELLFWRALSIREQQLGPVHPDTASSLNNLAQLYQKQEKYTEAEPLFQRALSIREQQLGPIHPDTAISLNNLAHCYSAQGKYVEAEPLFRRALSIYEEAWGPVHPSTKSMQQRYNSFLQSMRLLDDPTQ